MKKGIQLLLLSGAALLTLSYVSKPALRVKAIDSQELWSAPFVEKVLRSGRKYAHGVGEISVDAAKDEAEAAQLVLEPAENCSYRLTLEDLKRDGGTEIYEATHIDVYQAMYVNVPALFNGRVRNLSSGYYPDAMLPYEAAVKKGVNAVEKGNRLSLYFDFNIPFGQMEGTYRGTFLVALGNKEIEVPVTLRVRSIAVNPDVSTLSMFSDTWTHCIGEYNGSQRMQDLYHKALMKYRVCPTSLVVDTSGNDEDAAYYAEKVVELYRYGSDESVFGPKADRFTNFTIPVSLASAPSYAEGFKRYLKPIVNVSCREKVNLLERCRVYCIDEPAANGTKPEYCANILSFHQGAISEIRKMIEGMRGDLKNTYGVDDDFVDALIEGTAKIHNVVTQSYTNEYAGTIDTFCPLFDSYDTPSMRQKYQEVNPDERWWYGCLVPAAPFPTYHIDDLGYGPRLVGWLQNLYGVRGNLYWATDSYAAYQSIGGGAHYYRYLDDYYSTAALFDIYPGEGYLFRPGKSMGVDGPLPTIRLTSIRDGLEEYELMNDIQKEYKAVSEAIGLSFDASSSFVSMISKMVNGMQLGGTVADFVGARQELLDLSEFTESGVVFPSYSDDSKGHLDYGVYVPAGTTLTVEGATKLSEEAATGGTLYHYGVDMTNTAAEVAVFKATNAAGKTYSLTRNLPGKVVVHGIDSNSPSDFSGTDLTGASFVTKNGENAVQLALQAVGADEVKRFQKVTWKPSYLSEFNDKVVKAVFKFFFDGGASETLPLLMLVKYKNKIALSQEVSVTLKQGENLVSWNSISGLDWTDVGSIEKIDFRFADSPSGVALPARHDIYFMGTTIYQG